MKKEPHIPPHVTDLIIDLTINGRRCRVEGVTLGAPLLGHLSADMRFVDGELGAPCLGAITPTVITGNGRYGKQLYGVHNWLVDANQISVHRTVDLGNAGRIVADYIIDPMVVGQNSQCHQVVTSDWRLSDGECMARMGQTIETWQPAGTRTIIGACTIIYQTNRGRMIPADVRTVYEFDGDVIADPGVQARQINFDLGECNSQVMRLREFINVFDTHGIQAIAELNQEQGLRAVA